MLWENIVMKTIEINSILMIITETWYFLLSFLPGIICCPVSVLIQDYKHVANTGLCNLEWVLEHYSSFNH